MLSLQKINSSILKIFIAIVCVLTLTIDARSELSFSFRDTSIERGYESLVPLYGTINQSGITDMRFVFSFDSRIVDVKGGLGSDKFGFKSSETGFSIKFPRIDSAVFEITSANIQQISNGIIFQLRTDGLVFSDSIVKIKLEEVYVNGLKTSDYSFTSGMLKVLGDPYLAHLPDNLGPCIPNPCVGGGTFDFSLENESIVKFSVYTSLGRLVMTSDDNFFETFKSKGLDKNIIITDYSKQIPKGHYSLIFNPQAWEFAQGLYLMIMQTDKGAYKTNFMFFKN